MTLRAENSSYVVLYSHIDEIRAITVSKEVLLIAGKVLRMFKRLDPPGRFLVPADAGWVVDTILMLPVCFALRSRMHRVCN
jgi:hypothetical protein